MQSQALSILTEFLSRRAALGVPGLLIISVSFNCMPSAQSQTSALSQASATNSAFTVEHPTSDFTAAPGGAYIVASKSKALNAIGAASGLYVIAGKRNLTCTLPPAATGTGKEILVMNDGYVSYVHVVAAVGETIDTLHRWIPSKRLSLNTSNARFISDGVSWCLESTSR